MSNLQITTSPVSLSYVAALRGVSPRRPGDSFVYADLNCKTPDLLICLAASNPEGKFFGLIEDKSVCVAAEKEAQERDVGNVTFINSSIIHFMAQVEQGMAPISSLNYLSCDEGQQPLKSLEREALYKVAEKLLIPGGLFSYTYPAYEGKDGALRFLVREFSPEMNGPQAIEFLQELKKLGSDFFAGHSDLAMKLDNAIAKNLPDEFFALFDQGKAQSMTFDTIVALRPRGFIYAGDSSIPANYIELMVPKEAQDIIVKCVKNPLYEAIKDFVLNRQIRTDIWCRQPVPHSNEVAELFGPFTYGIGMAREDIPSVMQVQGKAVDLSSSLFTSLIDLLVLLPATIGDFLAHPSGKNFAPLDVVGAVQILVALGIAQPMRGHHEAGDMSNVEKPQLVGGYNKYLEKTSLTGSSVWMSSPVVGSAIKVSARDALVMQALDRAGLANSASALLSELERLAQNPAQASRVMDTTSPTAEIARDIVQDVVGKSIVKWYAYGLLEAA